jgi:hypothetical protein
MASFNNRSMTELNIPRSELSDARLRGFYRAIGWQDVRPDETEEGFWYVGPFADREPTLTYWQTKNPAKLGAFVINPESKPSVYSQGLHLPAAAMAHVALVETVLITPSDDHTVNLWEQGGGLLEAHATVPLHEHCGAQEFRFQDPFGFSLRVTADPGYQMPGTQ